MYSDWALASGTRDIGYSSFKERLKKCRNFQKNSTELEVARFAVFEVITRLLPFPRKTENIPKSQNLFCSFSVHRKANDVE